jgi:ATP-GRASP peptide maturase of grasp-with-spasm system
LSKILVLIVIFSQDYSEPSTDEVIDWIDYLNIPFKRLNGIDFYNEVSLVFDKKVNIKLPSIYTEEISVVWFRRWIATQNRQELLLEMGNEDKIDPFALQFNEYLKNELKVLTTFFFDNIPCEKLYSKIHENEINKLNVLKKAVELGISIPATYVFSKKHEFEVITKSKRLITKSISNSTAIKKSGISYVAYTSVCDTIPNEVGEQFSPSLFQEFIPKRYEIRAFLINKIFYSMAIFSQSDTQTQVDFRKYNQDNPNRLVPFKLPVDLENKLINLANSFDLKNGSFDLIRTVDGEYIFLEVNPEGQFGMVSYPCNYFLERRIAEELIKQSNKNEHKKSTTR